MAGVDKVCEYSYEYPGQDMYRYKRNHIQILPKYRKMFREAKAHVEINEVEHVAVLKSGALYTIDQAYVDYFNYRNNTSYTLKSFLKNYNKINKGKFRLKKMYWFCLVVEDEHLQGEVEGRYYNSTTDLRSTLKRLKRMLRCRSLKVVKGISDD